ncbi:MAG: hypothetical protein M1821_007033 [Bathelium mastoideum]|nr:MAG: hypothetical protein M1821_007033 [Bathelium mastoideum]
MNKLSTTSTDVVQQETHALACITINSPSKKRKRGSDAREQTPDQAIVACPYPASSNGKPRALIPLFLIPRSHLPLSHLDPGNGPTNLSNRLFSACIPTLADLDDKKNQNSKASVLITRLEEDGALYAVEHVRDDVFALCRLGSWVKEGDLTKHTKSETGLKLQNSGLSGRPTALHPAEWWHTAAIGEPSGNQWRRKQFSRNDPSVNPSPEALPTSGNLNVLPEPGVTEAQGSNADKNIEIPNPGFVQEPQSDLQPSSTEEIYSNIIQKYLDTLYLSRTSLAYFAKGPLSRARVAFTDRNLKSMQTSDLAHFLRQCLLPKSMDKKYRDKLPDIAEKVALAAPPVSLEGSTVPKRRKSKKLKPNTNGIFPEEEEYVRRWWYALESTDPGVPSPENRNSIIRSRLAELRIRETQMQLILALEVLALEAQASSAEPKDVETQVEVQAETQKPQSNNDVRDGTKPKDDKPKDLGTFLDLLVDRLCIWQSLQHDDHLQTIIKDKKEGHDASSSQPQNEKRPNDALRAFCIEVIIPFYMSRLPKQAASVNKKLGGPSAPSPIKRTSRSQPSRKPGEPAIRPKPTKPERKPLHRVTSETINRPTKRPALVPPLARSATDSTLLTRPVIKRESSEVPSLSSLPAREPSTTTTTNSTNRSALPTVRQRPVPTNNLRRFSQREVDFDAMTAAHQAKLRRKADVDRKLREAISAVQKPRRALVGRETADETELRRGGGGGGGRGGVGSKGGSGSGSGFVEGGGGGGGGLSQGAKDRRKGGVQVTATPKKGRRSAEVVMVTPHRVGKFTVHRSHLPDWGDGEDSGGEGGGEEADLPSSSFVPSTGVKSRGNLSVPPTTNHGIPASARALMDRRMNEGVAETPSRGPAKRVSFFTSSSVTVEGRQTSQVKEMTSNELFETPRKASDGYLVPDNVLVTPTVSRKTNMFTADADKPSSQETRAEKSIYDTLGWNDDIDDLA